MTRVLKVLVVVAGIGTLVAFVTAAWATRWAYEYRARTGEGLAFAWALAAWAGVVVLALVTGAGARWWRARRAARRRRDDHARRSMTRRTLGVVVLAAVLAAATALLLRSPGSAGEQRLSEAQARAHLARLVAAVRAGDFDGLCALAGSVSNCRVLLADAGRDAVPAGPPEVVAATYHEARTGDGTPGWVLTVAGTDGRGRPFTTEVLVFRDDESRVRATNAVYWSNARIDFGDPHAPTSPG